MSAARAAIAKYTGAVTNYAAIQPVSGVGSEKGKTVWWVPIGSSVPALAAVGNAMSSAFSKVGIKMQTCDGKLLPTDIASCLSEAATQGADGVVTGFIDYSLVPTSFQKLVARHVPVLIAGEAPGAGQTSNDQLGYQSTRLTDDLSATLNVGSVITHSNGKAKMLYLGITDSSETEQEAATAKAYVAQACPGCSFTEVNYNTASIQKLPSQVSASLISNPSINYVVCESDACADPAVSGIQTAGDTSKVKLSSSAGDLDSLQRIQAGHIQFADTGISTVYLGWQFADGIIRMLAKHAPVSALGVVRVFTKNNVGGLTLTPVAYATNAWYGSNAYEQTFLRAWGAS